MNGYHRFVIHGVVTPVSPLHISDPNSQVRFHLERNAIVYSKERGSFPMTATRQAAFWGLDKERKIKVPIIPATTWRGGLRRAAASIIERHVVDTLNEKLSYEVYRGMRCGAVTGSPDKIGSSTDEILTARNHVFYGIFGGGPRMLRGGLMARDSLPVTEDTVASGYVPEDFMEFVVAARGHHDFYSFEPVIRKDDFYKNDAQDVVRDYAAIHAAEHAESLARIPYDSRGQENNDDANEDSDKVARGVQAMSFRQDIVPGLPFYFHIELNGTPAQLGLILASLDILFNSGIGGRYAMGMGRMKGELNLKCDDLEVGKVASIKDGVVTLRSPAEVYLEAQYDAVTALTLNDVERYMIPAKKEKPDKK